ncbi:MAG TPA: hypothetical protein VK661_09425 [Planctomycetota bacterium]|nr:hypothetical protein [Planctomycetota bacterium]
MKRWILAALPAVAAAGCEITFDDPDLQVRQFSEDELKAPPGESEVKSAIIGDVRERRMLLTKLDEGRATIPPEIRLDNFGLEATRARDGKRLVRVILREDPADRVDPTVETAFWDNEVTAYYYHYEGGHPHRDVWFGPLRINMARKTTPP